MKKIFCLIALMIATVSLASAQVIGAYSLTKSSGAYAEMAGGTALDLSTVKYVAEPEANATVAFAYGADGLVQGTKLTDIKGLPLGFDFEYNGTMMKYFAINGSGIVYLSDTESFQVWPAQPYNALTAGASYSTAPCVGMSGSQSKVRITDDTAITYSVSGDEGKKVFTAQFKGLVNATNYNGSSSATSNMQIKLYQENGRVELIFGAWSGESSLVTRMGLAGLNGDMLNVKGSLDAPTTASTSSTLTIVPANVVAGTTFTFDAPAPCVTPTVQPTELTATVTSVSAEGQFTPVESGADHYLIALLQGDATFTPADGEMYAAKATPAEGVTILDYTTGNTYRTQTLGDLVPSTDYTVRVYAANSLCKGGPVYNLVEPLEYKFTTALDMPASLDLTPASPTSVKINVAADAKGDQVLVAVNQNPALNFSTNFPESYGAFGTPTGTYKVGDEIEGGGRVVYVGPAKDGIVAEGFTPNQPVYVNAWSTDGAGNYGTIYQEGRTSTELQLPYAADYHNMGTYMEPAGYVVNDEFISNVTVDTGADGHTAVNGFSWKSSGAAGADDMAEGTVTLPAFQIPAAGARMTFDYQIYIWGRFGNSVVNWEDQILDVEVAEAGTDNYKSIFKLGDGNDPEVIDTEFHTYTVTPEAFKAYVGKKVSLRFKWSRYNDAYSFIHNIFIEEVPEIDYASEVTVTAVDGGDVTIDWTDRYAEAAKWEVRYQKVGTTSWSAPVATTEKPYTVKGLDLSSQYTIQVRVVAGEKVSPWAEVSARTSLGSPYSITFEALPFTDGWEAKQFAVDGTAITLTDDAVTNWRYNANYGLMYSGNYDRALVTPAIKLGDTEKLYTITVTPGRAVTSALKNASYIAVSKDNGATWKVADAVSFDGLTSSVQMSLSGSVKVALCIAKGNTTFYIKGFGIEATYDPELAGKSVENYSEKAATVQPRTWYVLTQTRNGESPAYDSELGGKIMRASKNFSIPKGSNVEEYTQYLIRLLPTEFEGVYHMQWGNGHFWGATLNSVESIEDAGLYKVYNINGEDTHFGINATDGTTLGQPLDNNGEGKDVAFWGSGEVTSLDGNNDWKFYPVEFGIYDAEQLVRNAEMAELIAQLEKTMAKNDRAQVGDNLITEESQLSSDYSDPDEGKSLGALIDENPATYWHTNWHSVPAEGTHPTLKIELAEPISGDIQLTFQRRDSKRDHSTGMQILTSTDGENYTEAATVELPFTATGEVVRGIFNLAEPAKYLAVYSNGAVQGNGTTPEDASRNYWHVAELQLNKYISATPLNEKYPDAAAALQQAISVAKAIDKPSAEDIAALQAAYEAYVEGTTPKPFVLGPQDISDEKAYIIYTEARGGLTVVGEEATALNGTSENGVGQTVEDTNVLQQFAFVGYEGDYYLYSLGAQKYVSVSGLTEKAANPIQFADADESTVRLYFDGQHNFNLGGSKQFTCDTWKYKDAGNSFIIKAVADFDQSALVEAIAADVQQSKLNAALAETIAQAQAAYDIHNIAGDVLIHEADQFSSPYTTTDDQCDDIDEVYTYLLDNDVKTYWHSAWEEGEQPMHTHYLQVNLAELVDGDILLQMTRRNVLGNHITKMSVEASTDGVDFTQAAAFELPYTAGGETVSAEFKLDTPATFLRFFADETTGNEANAGYWHAAEFQLFKALEKSRNEINPDVAAALQEAIETAKAIENATQEDIDALVQALSVYNASIMKMPADTETMYFTAEQLRNEVLNIGHALIGILGVTTTGDKYINGSTQTERASADGTLAGVRAPEEAEYIEVLPADGGYYLRQHSAEEGQGYLACAAGGNFSITDQAGANVWTIVGPDEEGYGDVSGYDDIYSDIAKELNPNMVRFISQGQYLNGQTFGQTGGLRGGTGAWSFNYVRNANYVVEEPEVITYTIKFVNTPEDGAYLQIGGNWYSEGETVESETELTAEDITVSCDPAYTYEISIENGVITVTFAVDPLVGINGISGDAKNATIYNLQGQRINAAGRGLNVVNGKKVLKK